MALPTSKRWFSTEVEAAHQVRPSQSRVTKNRQKSFTDSLLELDSQISQKQTYSHSDLQQQLSKH